MEALVWEVVVVVAVEGQYLSIIDIVVQVCHGMDGARWDPLLI